MRIVDRTTFLAMPPGTVFAKFEPHVFGSWAIKERTIGNDFVVQDLEPWFGLGSEDHFSALDQLVAGEPSPPLDFDCAGRDGLFDKDQLFALLDRDDVAALIARLQQAVGDAFEQGDGADD